MKLTNYRYQRALSDLAPLTGPSELLPRWAYGVWYSEYYDRTAAQYENTILPKFRADGVPLDVLVTDTDFKSPSTWDGWEMDPAKFPDPKAFFDWSAAQGLHNTLNIHPSIVSSDPQFAQAQATAKGGLTLQGDNYVFDWGNPDQLKAYLDLHQTMEQQGADFWWLDWCCENSYSSLQGVTPDAWINQQYATDTNKTIGRGFAFSRAYGSLQAGGYSGQAGLPTGPWADKRTTVHFTGDTTSNWDVLKFEVGYTPGVSASTGLSAVSHDIGGFNNDGTQVTGSEPGSTKEADDLYARWLQLGAFQPVDRLHGNHSDRLPWQYGADAKNSGEKFLNLREDLVPYTYTLAQQANRTGIPVVRPLYLQYPNEQDAYAQDGAEYLYGPDVLVAPVTTAGSTATTSVWFPPGSGWTDYFTGQTYAGGTTQNITTDLSTMPVFIRSGGIMTTRTVDHRQDWAGDIQAALPQAHDQLTHQGGVLGRALHQRQRVLRAVDADPQRHNAAVLSEVHPIDHERHQVQRGQIRREKFGQRGLGRGHELPGHRRLTDRRSGGGDLGAHRFQAGDVAAGRQPGQHPLQRHLAQHLGVVDRLVAGHRQLT